MFWLLATFMALRSWFHRGWLSPALDLSSLIHHHCVDLTPLTNPAIHQALVCGTSLPTGSTTELLKNSALLHLFIGSGSHLVFWLTFIEALRGKSSRRILWVA